MRYVIGTGWWCSNPNGTKGREFGLTKVGDPVIRSRRFFDIWLYFIRKYTKPEKILVVDSASPTKPPRAGGPDQDYEYISLDRNYHAVKKTLFNGWLRGFMVGAWYAWNCDCDFIYVEQDCLAFGRCWVEACYRKAQGKLPLFGAKYRSPIQQSLVFLPHTCIPRFLFILTQIKESMICEARFHEVAKTKGGVPYSILPFGPGRARPIDWNAKYLYVQHWTNKELAQLGKHERIKGKMEQLLKGG